MTQQVIQLPLEKIKCDNQIRSGELDEQELIGLAITIREAEQQVPIRVRPDGEKYAIVDGHRRYRAMMRLKRPTIAAIVDVELNEGEALYRQWINNCQRSEISPLDRAKAIQRLMELTGWSPTETAKRLGVTGSAVSRAISLLTLPEPIIAKVEEGSLAPSTAVELVKVSDPATQAALVEAAVNGELSRDAVSAEVKRQKIKHEAPDNTSPPLKRVIVQLDNELSVTVTGEALTPERVVAALDQARAKVRRAPRGLEQKAFVRMLREHRVAGSAETVGGHAAKPA